LKEGNILTAFGVMFNWLRDNKKNVFLAFVLAFSFYLVAGPLIYTNPSFQEYLENRGRSKDDQVLGIISEEELNYQEEEIGVVVYEFINDLQARNFERIYETTDVGRNLDFSRWHKIEDAEMGGDIRYEGEEVGLVKVNFLFVADENDFKYPLTVVLVLNRGDEEDWRIKDVEYSLDRYYDAIEK